MIDEQKKTHIKVTAIYKSGREEIFEQKLNKGGIVPANIQARINELKNFPTVVDVKVEKL